MNKREQAKQIINHLPEYKVYYLLPVPSQFKF